MTHAVSKSKQSGGRNTPLAPFQNVRSRDVRDSVRLILFVRAGGRCEFQGCNRYLLQHPITLADGNFAQMAHIVAFSSGGPRGRGGVRPSDINNVDNLMLLCQPCHHLIDDRPYDYTVATLREYKRRHEERIFHLTGLGPDQKTTIVQLKATIRGQPVDIPVAQVTEAVAPRYPSDNRGHVIDLTALDCDDLANIPSAVKVIDHKVDQLFAPGMDVEHTRHISLFALAAIPLLVYFGSRLSNKVTVDFYQRHRDTGVWMWKTDGYPVQYMVRVHRQGTDSKHVALMVSLSGTVRAEMLPAVVDSTYTVYEITQADGQSNPNFLRLRQDLINFRSTYQAFLRQLVREHGILDMIRVFPAMPAPIAVSMGYELLPKVDPTLVVYDYDKTLNGFNPVLKVNEL